MTLKQFIIKTISVIGVLVLIALVLSGITIYADTMISNYLAVGQLENDDSAFFFMQMYTNIGRPVIDVLMTAIMCVSGLVVLCNTIKYLKTIISEKYYKYKEKLNEKDF